MFPIPLSWKINHTSLNASEWRSYDFEYCDQGPFPSAAALVRALKEGKVTPCPNPGWYSGEVNGAYDSNWAFTDENRQGMQRCHGPAS